MVLEGKKAENAKKIVNNKDIEDDQELKEELNEWEVESTEAGD
jgi:arginine repressor